MKSKKKEEERQKELLDSIRYQGEMLKMRLEQHELMDQITKNLVVPELSDHILEHCLALLGDYFDATQLLIFSLEHEQEYIQLRYSWVAGNEPPKIGNFNIYDTINTLYSNLPTNSNIPVTTFTELSIISRETYEKFYDFGITSLMIAPIYIEGKLWGMINIEYFGDPHVWTLDEKDFMVMISNTISSILLRKIYDAKLSEALEQALAASNAKSIFLTNMSHEIRTPLNAILGMAEIQLQKEMLPPKTEEAFNIIYDSANLLAIIINDILDFSKIEAGKLELNPSEYHTVDLLGETAKIIRLRYESKSIPFSIKVDESTPQGLVGDEIRIKQILGNLLSNAYKYTDDGSVMLEVFAADYPEDDSFVMLVFRISDTGQGMSKDELETIFEEYARFNMRKNITVTGTGLGMSITKRLLDLMGGDISIESEPLKGTTVTVKIPQKKVDDAVIGTAFKDGLQAEQAEYNLRSSQTQFAREYMPYGKVLVVDDVETNLYVAKGLLIPYGLMIETVTSGFKAIEKVKSGHIYDVIFMDHMMPQLDGMDTMKFLRETGYTQPIVALTANAAAGQEEVFLASGFDGFISKPIDMNELNSVLNEMIRDKQPEEVIKAARRESEEIAAPAEKMYSLPDTIFAAFQRDAKKALAVLDVLLAKLEFEDDRDIKLYVTSVHGMKNALEMIGEKDLSAFAFDLEQAGREHNIALLLTKTPILLNNIRSLISKMKYNDVKDDVGEFDEDEEFLTKQMAAIKAACTTFDKKFIKTALAELKGKVWSQQTLNDIDAIGAYLLHSNFTKIIDVADEITRRLECEEIF